jgi:hypothetical protein
MRRSLSYGTLCYTRCWTPYTSVDPSDATSPDEFPCPDDCFDAPKDEIRCVPSLDHNAVETFDLHPVQILLSVQIMSGILENQQMLRCNGLEDFFPEITISGPSVPVTTPLRRTL